MCAHSSPLGEPGTNPGWTSWTIGFYRFFDFLKAGLASLRIMVVFGATPAGVPLAYAESPSREHDHLHSPGVSTPVGLALLLPSSALRCLRTRTPPSMGTGMGTLEHGGCCCGHGRHSRRIGRATRTGATVSHRGRRHRVVRLPGNHWRTRALRERADGRTGTGAPLLLGLSVGTYTEGWSSALPSLARCLPSHPSVPQAGCARLSWALRTTPPSTPSGCVCWCGPERWALIAGPAVGSRRGRNGVCKCPF